MTTGTFETVILTSIFVDREVRQRRELKGVEELAQSISEVGLINPPVVDRNLKLIAGERRLEACRSLGWDSIPVQFADDLPEEELYLIELEENVKRLDLTWQEQNDAIARYHEMRAKADPEWNATKTAKALGLSSPAISQHLAVSNARKKVPDLSKTPKLSTALNLVRRAQERKAQSEILKIKQDTSTPVRPVKLIHGDFLAWAPAYSGHPFNLIHCDFPYGINATKTGQSAAKTFGGYEDTPEVYFNLINCLLEHQDTLVAESAHCLFWFSMNFYEETKSLFEKGGWRVDKFPLIWFRSNNKGIIPDTNRGGRRVYETCFLMSRGDRKIVAPVSNLVAHPVENEDHMSQKPQEVLRHFMRMLVDENTVLLDPTAGSAGALDAAEALGAALSVGVERDREYYERAKMRLGL